jgi:hypothetical protein
MSSKSKLLSPLVAAAILLSTAPAFADSAFCLNVFAPPYNWSMSCTTGAIGAGSGHHIYFEVGGNSSYTVQDIITNMVIAGGSTGLGTHSETVSGLYGYYKVEASGIDTFAYISNT